MDSLFRRPSIDTEHEQVVNKSPQDDTPDAEGPVAEEAVTHLGKNWKCSALNPYARKWEIRGSRPEAWEEEADVLELYKLWQSGSATLTSSSNDFIPTKQPTKLIHAYF